ncbi:GntR family transcriptional regulator [Sinomonas notoginsengisoli]|uniref:GntR family transcriptional regulator n=1 Tax=Sinomonas notoginsengisoli TaxID=1457311 RepID=UPI001F40F402|nr:GntR family transcriptional regulator [Sinomonas notoginsengisoli]
MPTKATKHDGRSIYAALRAEILNGVLPAAAPVREVEVAERFGVSRTPVREALGRLQHERLLERGTRGLVVHQPDPQEVIQVYDLRIMLEEEAAGQAARFHVMADIARLEGLLGRDRAMEDHGDLALATANMEFHEAVWAAAHNRILVDLLEQLSLHLIRAPRSTLSVGSRWQQSLEEHGRLIAAIAARDEAGARALARAHLEEARRIRLELIRETISQGL